DLELDRAAVSVPLRRTRNRDDCRREDASGSEQSDRSPPPEFRSHARAARVPKKKKAPSGGSGRKRSGLLKGDKPARGRGVEYASVQSRPLQDLDILRVAFEILSEYRGRFRQVAARKLAVELHDTTKLADALRRAFLYKEVRVVLDTHGSTD